MKNRKRFQQYLKRLREQNKHGFWYDRTCPDCDKPQFHFDRYDAACCLFCNTWLEGPCSDPGCPYCANRPETPWEALFYESERWHVSRKKDWLRHNYQHKLDGERRHERRRSLRKDDLS